MAVGISPKNHLAEKKKEKKKDAEWLLMLYFKNGIILGAIKGNTVPPSSLTSIPVDICEPNLRLFFQTVKRD